mgnify:FL=1
MPPLCQGKARGGARTRNLALRKGAALSKLSYTGIEVAEQLLNETIQHVWRALILSFR